MGEGNAEINGNNGVVRSSKEEQDDSNGFDVIFNYVGGSNLFQWLLLLSTSIQSLVLVGHHLGSVFLAADPDHWCRVDELSRGTNWTAEQIKNISIPYRNGKHDQCLMYDLDYDSLVETYDSFQAAFDSLKNHTGLITKACNEWTYNQSIYQSTVVTQFNLVCGDHHYVASIQASYMGGIFLGSLVSGPLSDKLLGRRKTVLIAAAVILLSGYAAAFAKSFVMFTVLRFFLASGVSACYNNCFVLLLEYTDKKYRSVLGILQQLPFAFGYMAMPILAYYFRYWHQLQLSFATFSLGLVTYIWILPESARWLASRERDDEAIEYLRKVAKWNKRELPPREILVPILMTCREEEEPSDEKLVVKAWKSLRSMLVNYVNLVRTPELRLRSISIWTLFICVTLVYYGAVFDSGSITGDPFLMVFLSGAMEIPAYTVMQPLVSFWGRRPTLLFFFASTAACNFVFIAIPSDQVALQMVVSLLAKLFVSSAFAVIYLLGAELYPTSVRMTGIGAAVLMGRFGSITAPYVIALLKPINPKLPVGVFGSAALVGVLAAWILPETKDLEMADVVIEVEEQGHGVRVDKHSNGHS